MSARCRRAAQLNAVSEGNTTPETESQVQIVETAPAEDGVPLVYFTADISPEGLQAVYEALAWNPGGNLAVKVSTGEPPASNYLRAELIGPLVQSLGGTIVECNTAYGGSRSDSAMHRQVAEDHGFTSFAPFDLLDEEGGVEWPVTGGSRLNRAVGSYAENLCQLADPLSLPEGHAMAGFGRAIKTSPSVCPRQAARFMFVLPEPKPAGASGIPIRMPGWKLAGDGFRRCGSCRSRTY